MTESMVRHNRLRVLTTFIPEWQMDYLDRVSKERRVERWVVIGELLEDAINRKEAQA